jgi:hypothetical protein
VPIRACNQRNEQEQVIPRSGPDVTRASRYPCRIPASRSHRTVEIFWHQLYQKTTAGRTLTTSRARRVKCDEQRPYCLKCLSTGRTCEGYNNNREWIVVVAPPLPVTDGFEDDRSRRHFDYFRSQAVYELSWYFDGDHWGRLVLQESHGSAAVRHAVIALACCHEDFKDSAKDAVQAPQYAYAAKHYSKAIRYLIKETADNAHETRLKALMCGLLFIAIEVLRGNDSAARNHLDGCLKIVQEVRGKSGRLIKEGNCHDAVAYLSRDIIPMFARLDSQAGMMLGRASQEPSDPGTRTLSDPSLSDGSFVRFETIVEAAETLFWLSNRVHELVFLSHDLYRN